MSKNNPASPITAHRTAADEYTITNNTGAQLRVAPPGTPNAFSPGELLEAALAGCAALAAEAQLAHSLGTDFDAEASVRATIREGLIAELIFELQVDFGELDAAKQEKLKESALRKIDKLCAVKNSLKPGIPVRTELLGD
ncbi:OsmC family protein [Corynebacterium callunae]|uniref:OsmC family protein n=1 Tax=Corynebacterium callunae TaxID=1721 RepID=UPI0039828FF7